MTERQDRAEQIVAPLMTMIDESGYDSSMDAVFDAAPLMPDERHDFIYSLLEVVKRVRADADAMEAFAKRAVERHSLGSDRRR